MQPITNFKELEEGKEYNIFSQRFNVTNRARFICGDHNEVLNRPISYWQFIRPGTRIIKKEQLKRMFKENIYPDAFVLWDFNLTSNTITEIN